MFDFFVTPWTIVCHAPLFMGFPRKEYCSGLPFPPLGDLPHPGIEHESPALAGGFSTTVPTGKPLACTPLYVIEIVRYNLNHERTSPLHNAQALEVDDLFQSCRITWFCLKDWFAIASLGRTEGRLVSCLFKESCQSVFQGLFFHLSPVTKILRLLKEVFHGLWEKEMVSEIQRERNSKF